MLFRSFGKAGFQTAFWDLPPRPAETVRVRLESTPYHPSNQDPRTLGAAVVAFGFTE